MKRRIHPDESGRIRTNPDKSGLKRTPLYKGNDKGKVKSNNKSKAKDKVDNDKNKRKLNKIDKGRRSNSRALEGKAKSEAESASTKCRQAALAPATTPPIMPQASDARGSGVIKFPAPSGSVNDKRGPQRIGDIVSGMMHRYDVDAMQFSGDIYQALKIPFDPMSVQGRRECGSFASVWMKAKLSGLPPPVLDELRSRAIQEASKLAKRRRKCGNISAVWCAVFKRLLSARCSENKCKVM